jgi:hypothetical protein
MAILAHARQTENVSDLGRGLFSFEFPAQIETSASREPVYMQQNGFNYENVIPFKNLK